MSLRLPTGRSRPGSSRNPNELRCQNADCACLLDVSAIPVEAETILRELFRHLPAFVDASLSPSSPAPASLSSTHAFSSSRTSSPVDTALPSSSTPRGGTSLTFDSRLAPLESFRDASRRGDTSDFVILVSEAFHAAAGCDWPLCDACMETTLKSRLRGLESAAEARDAAAAIQHALRAHVHALGATASPTASSGEDGTAAYVAAHAGQVEQALDALAAEERALDGETVALSGRLQALRAEEERLDALEAALNASEGAAWLEYMHVGRAVGATRGRMATLRDRDVRAREHLSRLRYVSVHNDAFFIWHRGPFVTINGCRLGRLPAQAVDWTEINAALGLTAMLLTTVASRIGFSSQKYRIVPLGSFSRVAPIGDEKTMYELFYDNRMFASRRLNFALKALVGCIGELGEHAQGRDKSFRLPYAITHGGEKVADLNVTLGKEAQWTRAMKCALTNLKWLLAWAYRQPEQTA